MSGIITIHVSPQPAPIQVTAQPGSAPSVSQDIVDHVYGETPAGLVNGVNAIFNSLNAFVPESLEVFANGLKLKLIDDYTTQGNSQITLLFSPDTGERILINYLKL